MDTKNLTCRGVPTGQINITVTAGTGPFMYSVRSLIIITTLIIVKIDGGNHYSSSPNFADLAAGSYNVTVKGNTTQCSTSIYVELGQPPTGTCSCFGFLT